MEAWQQEVRETLAEQTPAQRAVSAQWLIAFREFTTGTVRDAYDDVLGETARFEQEETQ